MSLPEEIEQALQQIVVAAPEEWFHALSDPDMVRTALLEVAGVRVKVTDEPKVIGELSDIYQYECVKKFAVCPI